MKKFILLIAIFFTGTLAFSQSADVVTRILNSEKATYGQVCYLSAVYQNLARSNASYSACVKALYDAKQIPELYNADDFVTYEEVAGIFSKMFKNLNKSIMYSATDGSSRYAYKLFKSDGVILSSADATQNLSGQELMNILNACLTEYGTKDDGMDMDLGE
jgi:hypothetical protein